MSEYEATKQKLNDAKGLGIIRIIEYVCRTDDGDAVAVIDVLLEAMADICKLIHHKHAERIDTDAIAKAATIAAKFVREPR